MSDEHMNRLTSSALGRIKRYAEINCSTVGLILSVHNVVDESTDTCTQTWSNEQQSGLTPLAIVE